MGRKIIIVEDSPADAKTLRVALARRDPDIETEVIEDGARAIEYFSHIVDSDLPDLILLDLNLPIVTGFEVLEFLKSDPQLKKLPVIVLSGSSSQHEIELCYAAGANSYFCKPTGIQEVFAMAAEFVNYWFGHAKLPRSIAAAHR